VADQLECEVGVVERRQKVRNDGLLINLQAEYLTLLIDANDTVRCLVLRSNEKWFLQRFGSCTHMQQIQGHKDG